MFVYRMSIIVHLRKGMTSSGPNSELAAGSKLITLFERLLG